MKQSKVIEVKKSGDSVVYKVPAAFTLLVVVLMMLRKIGAYYGSVEGFTVVLHAVRRLVWVFTALMLVATLGAIFLKKPLLRAVGRYVVVLSALAAMSCLVMKLYWTEKMLFLYLMHAVVYCLYMVYLLYGSEFFAYSLATSVAGCVFFLFSRGFAFNSRGIFLLALLLVVLAAVVAFAALAAKGKIRGMAKSFSPMLHYVVCGLWAVCLVLCVVLGPAFAYYCMFAAIAFELIAAVYYTFQLK